MKSRNWNRFAFATGRLFLLIALAVACNKLNAQAPARFVGTITAISGNSITVKTDAGDSKQVEVPATAVIKRLEPGQKDLSAAATIQLTDLATGDRVLVKLDPNSATPQALQIVAMKKTDIAQKQQQEQEEWQRNGTGGLVKSVDSAAGVVILTTGAGPTAKTVTVHIGKDAVLKRYASNFGSLCRCAARASGCDSCGRPIPGARSKERRRNGDHGCAGGFGQLQKCFGISDRCRYGCFNFDGEGSGNKEECHRAHYAGCGHAPPAGHDGEDDCRAFKGRSPGGWRTYSPGSAAGRSRARRKWTERSEWERDRAAVPRGGIVTGSRSRTGRATRRFEEGRRCDAGVYRGHGQCYRDQAAGRGRAAA